MKTLESFNESEISVTPLTEGITNVCKKNNN
jgi:hypothetical protein